MGRLFMIAAVVFCCAVSWVSAGNFEVLADAGGKRPQMPLLMQPGTVVKTEFKAAMKTSSDEDFNSDTDKLLPEPIATKDGKVKTQPVLAYKEKKKGMAPPRSASPEAETMPTVTSKNETVDLEADLEKDLVISPPPAKPEDKAETKPVVQKKGPEKVNIAEKKPAAVKKAASKVQKVNPEQGLAQAPRVIQKVKPVTQNPWNNPAGNYAGRYSNTPTNGVEPANNKRVPIPNYRVEDSRGPGYLMSEPRSHMAANGADRMIRDGVTVKLAPSAAPATNPELRDDSNESDILSAATEIIGLPFAFISSFF